jgi:thiol-disulfide isomerase/thioredoxin
MKTRTILVPLSFIIIFSFLFVNRHGLCTGVNLEPRKGGQIPVISLPVPKDSKQKIYLGLSSRDGFFKIDQVQAQVLLIEIFNLYCPPCQSTASALVELHHQIENRPAFRGKIKLIGIGAGNSQTEIEVFKQNHNIPFPVFPDLDFSIHKALGEVRTPFFIVIKINRDGSHKIVYTHLGGLTDIQGLLDLMYEAYGIPQEDLQRTERLATSTANQTSSISELD